jgi:acyl-coenzyme A synthetase/AMP-(fatty) acid ligase
LLARFDPREWFFLDELPTTASGKIQKFALRDRYADPKRDGERDPKNAEHK